MTIVRRYFIGFSKNQPISFAPIANPPSIANGFAKMPELHEVDFVQWYVFERENAIELYSPFPAHVPSESHYWSHIAY